MQKKKSRDYGSWRLEKLSDPERAARYLKAALAESTEAFFHAFKNVIQAHEVATVAKKAGVARESLYRSFSTGGNPTWGTLQSVLEALDLRFSGIEPRSASAIAPVLEPPKTSSARKSRGRRRRISAPSQQLALFEATVVTMTAQEQNMSVPAARSTLQQNTGAIPTRVDIESPVGLPGFVPYIQQIQSAGWTIGR